MCRVATIAGGQSWIADSRYGALCPPCVNATREGQAVGLDPIGIAVCDHFGGTDVLPTPEFCADWKIRATRNYRVAAEPWAFLDWHRMVAIAQAERLQAERSRPVRPDVTR
jgi:hypothetical protein